MPAWPLVGRALGTTNVVGRPEHPWEVADAITTMPSARSGITWLQGPKVKGLLKGLGSSESQVERGPEKITRIHAILSGPRRGRLGVVRSAFALNHESLDRLSGVTVGRVSAGPAHRASHASS